MFLTYGDLARLFPKVRGIKADELFFHTVATTSIAPQYKGIFIPCHSNSGDLQTAITNGAIAALWDETVTIPTYTPNHFPLFLTNDLLKGLIDMMELFIEKTNQADNMLKEEGTKFFFLTDLHHTNKIQTYDLAVSVQNVQNMKEMLQQGQGGAK